MEIQKMKGNCSCMLRYLSCVPKTHLESKDSKQKLQN
jgi:hypothetical protein